MLNYIALVTNSGSIISTEKSFRCSFYIACASQYCVGFHEKNPGCGWKEANVDGKRRIITWRFNIITGSFHSSKTD